MDSTIHPIIYNFFKFNNISLINPKTEKEITRDMDDNVPVENIFVRTYPHLELQEIEKKARIVRIGYEELRGLGFIIVSMRVRRGKLKYFKGQKVKYKIVDRELRGRRTLLDEVPLEHKILLDKSEKRVRLIGKNAGINKKSKWVKK